MSAYDGDDLSETISEMGQHVDNESDAYDELESLWLTAWSADEDLVLASVVENTRTWVETNAGDDKAGQAIKQLWEEYCGRQEQRANGGHEDYTPRNE